jgi:large subunit ribosomal protein L25
MSQQSTALPVTRREPAGSRSARRLRREGVVLGTVYGGSKDPVSFQIDARTLRNALAHTGAVIDLQIDGSSPEPVVLKERVRHPVTGDTMHVDLIRVDLNKPIQAQVIIELTDVEESDVRIGGVLDNPLREITVEALPANVPDVITHSIAELKLGGNVTLSEVVAPEGTTILGDLDQVIATIRSSRAMAAGEDGEIELETEVVGEDGAAAEGDADASADGDSE